MATIQLGLRGPKAGAWYIRAHTMDNEEFFLTESGKRGARPSLEPFEAESERTLVKEGRRRRKLYEKKHDEPYRIESTTYIPAHE